MPEPALPHHTALEHLRIIRTLMERANIYRAVSATAALTGGLLAMAVAYYGVQGEGKRAEEHLGARGFLLLWLSVLMVSGLANLVLLMREAGGKGQPFLSDGLRMALRAIVPPLLTGGVFGICLIWFESRVELATLIWIVCYGLALQGTVSFAPKSIIHLARAFLVTGQVLTVIWFWRGAFLFTNPVVEASALMGLTFGLFHVVYAVAVFASKPKEAGNA